MINTKKIAYLIVDLQNDFGRKETAALYVPDGEKVIKPTNHLREIIESVGGLVVLTADAHTEDSSTFAHNVPGGEVYKLYKFSNGEDRILWPRHCVDGTDGSKFLDGLVVKDSDFIVKKGVDRTKEEYSGFASNTTCLHEKLQSSRVNKVLVSGLALDYCVKATAIDAAKLDYKVCVATYASRGNLAATVEESKKEMLDNHIILAETIEEVIAFVNN